MLGLGAHVGRRPRRLVQAVPKRERHACIARHAADGTCDRFIAAGGLFELVARMPLGKLASANRSSLRRVSSRSWSPVSRSAISTVPRAGWSGVSGLEVESHGEAGELAFVVSRAC